MTIKHCLGALRMTRATMNKQEFVAFLLKEGYSKGQIKEIGEVFRELEAGREVDNKRTF